MAKAKKDATALPYDYSAFNENVVPDDDALGKISNYATEMHDLEKQIAEAEQKVKRLQEQHRQIAEERLPELFERVGISEIKTRSGLPLKLKNRVHANLSKDRKPNGIAWLDANGQGGMVRRQVIIDFDKTQADKVEKLLKLIGRGWPNHRTELDVNAQTLKAFIKRQLEAGLTIPRDIFGVHCVDVVEISSK